MGWKFRRRRRSRNGTDSAYVVTLGREGGMETENGMIMHWIKRVRTKGSGY